MSNLDYLLAEHAVLRDLVDVLLARGETAQAASLSRSLSQTQQVVDEHEVFFMCALDMLCIATTDGRFHKVNHAFERTLGYTTQELLAQPFFDLVHPDDVEQTKQEVEKLSAGIDTLTFDNRYRHKDGSYRWINWTTPAVQPGARYLYAVARDVTAQRQREQETLYLASHDALTGLVNRWRFNEVLQASLAWIKRDPARDFAVLLLDLDHFKPVNDVHGHRAGDTVLKAVAARLNAIRRESDVLCRLGGDEFALLAHGIDDAGAEDLARRMRDQIVLPVDIGGVEVRVDVSIGVAHVPVWVDDGGAILGQADSAMYRAKRLKGQPLAAAAPAAAAVTA